MQLLEKVKAAIQRVTSLAPDLPEPPGDPDEPYALVGAPKKPRTPLRSAAAAAPLTFEKP